MSDHVHDPETKFAWREVSRVDPPRRSAAERVADFLEIHGPYDEQTAREQAARCVQCPEPLCVAGCPLHSNIPEWLRLTAEGQFLEAAAILQTTSNLPEICAALCPSDRLCEGMCVLEGRAEPVSVGAIEQFLNHYAFEHDVVTRVCAPATGHRVAVLGAGPGGLTCADELALRGHAVTVFDSELVPGGLLVNGIPAFKLEKSLVQRRIDVLRKRGVVFRLGVVFGQDVVFRELQQEFDAFYLGYRSRQARALQVPGADLPGVLQALPFIVDKNTTVPLDLEHVDVSGAGVLVVGAGNVAIDCARTAVRCGAASVTCVYRRDEDSMTCSRIDYRDAVEEGVRFVFQAQPVAIVANGEGRAMGVRFVRTEPGEDEGRAVRAFAPVPESEFVLPGLWIFTALGFDALPLPHEEPFTQLLVDQDGRIVTDGAAMTSIPGVFAGGDMVRGPVPVLQAVRDARAAAGAIDHWLLAE